MSSVENKIIELTDLAELSIKTKKNKKKIVHAHGCFDLFHYGHLKYLEGAKKYGDILIVTLTPDKYIKKGPGRPVFNEEQRVELVASLDMVDYVALNNHEDAIGLIKLLQPDFTVRGVEYKNIEDDITGKMKQEKEAVEACGGSLVFIDDITYSSTSLINNNIKFPDDITKFKDKIKENDVVQKTLGIMDSINNAKVLVIGDTIIDKYIYTTVLGTVTKYPALSTSYKSEQIMEGGVLAIAKNIKKLVSKVSLVTCLGGKNSKYIDIVKSSLSDCDIDASCIIDNDDYTVVKTRYISTGYSNPLSEQLAGKRAESGTRLFEMSHLSKTNKTQPVEDEIYNTIKDKINEYDIVVVSDFGHGLLSKKCIELIQNSSCHLALNVQTNSSNFGFNLVTKYKNAGFVCIDELEARLALSNKHDDIDDVASALKEELCCDSLMITRGSQGINYYKDDKSSAPALASKVVDTVGAGDAVFSAALLGNCYSDEPFVPLLMGSIMGMIGANIVGNERSIDSYELIKNIKGIV
jgi:rfaE bifunctional protein kinase chain/domain/rfaE bifunctional protein nucleotidyltransferase chain/domain